MRHINSLRENFVIQSLTRGAMERDVDVWDFKDGVLAGTLW